MTDPVTDETALVVIPTEHEAAWAKIEASKIEDRMKRALRMVACGETIKGSAEAAGYASHSDLHRAAKRFGLIDVKTRSLIDTHRHISRLAGEELERRLIENPEDIKIQALAVTGGISTDKVLIYEKTAKDDGTSYLSQLEKVAERVAASGATMELTVSIKPADPQKVTLDAETIDVTPQEET